jgi:hypothetical protein
MARLDHPINFTPPFEDSTTGVDEGVTHPSDFIRRDQVAIHATVITAEEVLMALLYPLSLALIGQVPNRIVID